MKKRLITLFAGLAGMAFAFSQATQSPVLMQIGDEKVTASEFEHMYTKNLDLVQDPAQKDIDNYLNMFINYKLQLIDAKKKGLDKKWQFLAEYNKYKRELAKKYLNDEELIEKLTLEAYNRMKNDIKVAHIMVRLDADALPEDTLKAWQKINSYYKKLKKGAGFKEMAFKYSEDPSARENKGDLGWINVFHTVYPFETAAYNTPPGQISKPFRTRYGYHIVKTEAKRPAVYKVQVAQIMILKGKDPEKAEQKIREIYKKLKSGEARFEDLAKNYSDDKTTASKGGVMPPFGLREKVEIFEKHAFALKNPGDISEPFQTRFAWHILQLKKKMPVPPFEEVKKQLEQRVRRDERARIGEQKLIKKLRRQFPVKETGKLSEIEKIVDESFFERRWKYPQDFPGKEKTLFVIDGKKKVSYNDFIVYLLRHQKNNPQLAKHKKEVLKSLYEKFKDEQLLKYYRDNLDKFYPDYAQIIKEYYEGLLLFNYKSQEIWDKAAKDTTGLENFYEQHKQEYKTKAFVKVLHAETKDRKTAKKILKYLKKHKKAEEIEKAFAGKALMKERIIYASEYKKTRPELRKSNGTYIVEGITERIPERIPPLKEIKGRVLNAYQQETEKKLLASLRKKYPVKINQEVWNAIRAKYKK